MTRKQKRERVESVAKAICRKSFGVDHGDARCCQIGGKDGCCLATILPVARAAIKAADKYLVTD